MHRPRSRGSATLLWKDFSIFFVGPVRTGFREFLTAKMASGFLGIDGMSMENAMSKKLNGRGGRFVLLAAALLFAWGLRADTATVDGYTYTYSVTDGKVEIGTGEKVKAAVSPNPTGRLTVPSELGGYPVTGLGESAFSGTGVTDVTIPDGVTHIGPRAFASCASLENVTIGSGVTQIDFEVFPSCRHLRNIAVDPANTAYMSQNGMLLTKDGKTLVYGTCGNSVIPSGVTTIGRSAFFGRKLESVQFPSSVTNIGGWAFAWCRDLKLTIPDTVTQIDGDAFQSCFNLNVWLPRRFEGNLSPVVFRDCSNLTVNYYDQVPVVAFRAEEGVVEQRECLPGTKVGSLPSASTCEGYAFEGWWTAADGEQATAETVVTNDVTYYAKWRGTATVDSYTYTYSVLNGQAEIGASNAWTRAISPSPTGHVTVPSSLGGFPVVGIGAYAFESSNLESVTIPEGVTGIGKNSFRFCANLESVTIPSGVARIDEYSFYYCTNLESVTIPSGVAKIGDFAFYGCSKLKGVHISDLVNWCRIAFGVLASPLRQAHELYLNGERVTELVIPEGVTAIGADAFAGCSGLTDVTIPASVTNVGVDAFAACSNLTNIVVDPGNANYTSKSGLLLTKDGRTLVQGVNGVVTIPAGVDVIGPDAFYGCGGLVDVVIPASVTNIGELAFTACGRLMSISVETGNEVYSSRDGMLLNKDGTTLILGVNGDVEIPSGVVTIGEWAFCGYPGLTRVVIPASVRDIGVAAFYECGNLTNTMMQGGVTNIGSAAFWGCSGLTRLVIPDGVTHIGQNAFSSCDGLTEVFIPDSVQSIGYGAFTSCGRLKNLTLPACMVEGDDGWTMWNVFQGTSVENVTMAEGITTIGSYAFAQGFEDETCPTHVTIPNSVTSICAYAFYNCPGLKSVTIPEGVVRIGAEAFLYCRNLAELAIPNSVKQIDARAFSDCRGLTEITIPGSVTNVGSSAFFRCQGLARVTVPACVLEAGLGTVFPASSSITNVVLSEGCREIARNALGSRRDFPNLAHVFIPGSVATIDAEAFRAFRGKIAVTVDPANAVYSSWNGMLLTKDGTTLIQGVNGDVTIPPGVTSIDARAFYNCNGLTRVVIPNSVTDIGNYAFNACSNLGDVWMPKHLEGKLSANVFANCGNATLNYYDKAYTVTFRTEEGVVEQRQCPDGVEIGSLPSTPTHTGYAFEGWWTAADGEQASEETIVSDDVTYYAKWRGTATVDGYTYTYSVLNGQAEIGTGETGELSEAAVSPRPTGGVVIPSSLGGYPVTGIGEYAFESCTDMTDVEIPESVVSIRVEAFGGCEGLANVEIPRNVMYIDVTAFGFCYRFTVDPANAVYSSRNGLLLSKDGRTLVRGVYGDVEIPSSVTKIGDSAFDGCPLLESVTIPDGVLDIGAHAFCCCDGLENILIPQSVTNIGTRAFGSCYNLRSFAVDPANRFYSARDGFLLNKDGTVLVQGVNVVEARIPDGVTTIGEAAFEDCFRLECVEIPDSVTAIGDWAFSVCESLAGVVIPVGVMVIGDSAFSWCGLTCVTVPGNVKAIGERAFYGCWKLEGLEIARGVESIGREAFGDSRLTTVTIPDSVTDVGERAFVDCGELREVWLPRRLEGQLDPDVFLGCDDALALNYYDDLYTVVFKSDEEGVAKWRLCPAGVALGVLPPSPARAGAVFTGWWTADGEQVSAETVVTGDMTLEARWRVVAAPVITPVDGTSFQDTCTVMIACADTDAVIYCSIDGWAPHLTEAYRYTDPFQIDCTTTIRAIAVRDGVRSACAAATLTRAESLYYRRDAGTAGLSFMTGGNADWDYDWPDRECMRSGSIGNEEESWLQTSVVGRGTFSFRWKVDCEYDDFGEAAWDHLAVFTNGVEAVRMDGTRGWERMSFTFDDDGQHTIRWVFVKDGYDEEDAAYEDCAWLGRFSWNPADVAVDAGKGRTVTVPGTWLGKRTMRAATDMAANRRKVWECYLLGCDPEKAADDFRIASFEVVDGVPAFTFSHTRDGSGVSFEPRIRILGKARLDDAAWTEMPEGGDPALRFFKAEVALP